MAVLVSYCLLYFLILEKSWFSYRSFLGYPLLKGAKDEKLKEFLIIFVPFVALCVLSALRVLAAKKISFCAKFRKYDAIVMHLGDTLTASEGGGAYCGSL